jgi:hypothetical protein
MNKEKELLLELLIEKITNKYKSFDTDSNGDLLHKKYSQYGVCIFNSYSEMYQIIKKYSPNK